MFFRHVYQFRQKSLDSYKDFTKLNISVMSKGFSDYTLYSMLLLVFRVIQLLSLKLRFGTKRHSRENGIVRNCPSRNDLHL